MIHDPRCVECLISRVKLECSLAGADDERSDEIVHSSEELLSFLHTTPYSHPMVASILHRYVYRRLGNSDPFRVIKKQSNHEAQEIVAHHYERFLSFYDYVLGSVIGNMYDYGVKDHEVRSDFATFFHEEFNSGLFIDDTSRILPLTGQVVYFTDNSGEIVFDLQLIRFLKSRGSVITLVVRDGPILNDATLVDLDELGMMGAADHVMTTGAKSEIGVRFDLLSPEIRQIIENCSLIISKGMANYESLREFEGLPPVAYLLAAKCIPIAEELHVPRGSKLALLRTS